ncbi:MarR family transcriptional regulator [Cuneatibacter sp. NSJ-177]|uniref:MarR family winged helix-turn-helix transcriptional regulator n=1 Tax=Cuneatibacter sp. NSJ-177 TaxID=2931401 RepID=UPI001FD30860|nr:MarR family transcriptional regulator [Cuneatibacter sp. NSJ-177]MCJ7835352.1 MarR family transcriptional regulator [Cuneatibacter sp. NSJ-177]
MQKSEVREILWELDSARRRLLRPYFLEIGLTLGEGQPRILRWLAEHGPMSQRELADACRLDVTTMSRTLDRLAEAGYLERERNPECRRSHLISLTPAGREKAQQVIDGFRIVDERLLAGFRENEAKEILAGLRRMLKNLESAPAIEADSGSGTDGKDFAL